MTNKASKVNPTIAVHLTQRELNFLHQILHWEYRGSLKDKLQQAMIDIRPIIREARGKAKFEENQAKRQARRDDAIKQFFDELEGGNGSTD